LITTGVPLALGARLTLLFRHRDGAVYQAVGTVSKMATRKSSSYVEVRIPWDAGLSLAELAGRRAERALYDYAAKIKGIEPPLATLVYEGYVPYSLYAVSKGKAFVEMRKALDAPSGVYYVEFP
jgi:hypothetical protein